MMKFASIVALLMFAFQATGQDTLSLNDCFTRAKASQQNLTSEKYNLRISQVDLTFHKFSLFPNLSAYSNTSTFFGRRLDPITNSFGNSAVNSQSFGLNTSIPIFNGLNYFHTKKRLTLLNSTASINLDQKCNGLFSEIATKYIQLCLQQTQLYLSDQRIKHLESLLATQHELFKSGKITKVDTLRTVNTILKEQSERFELKQSFKSNVLSLNLLIGANLSDEFRFDPKSISEITIPLYQDEVFSIKKLALELEQLEVSKKLNTSSILPRISFNGSIGTGFSTNNKDFNAPGTPTIQYVDQLNQNLNQGIGLNLNIPVFNRGEYVKSQKVQKLTEEKLTIEFDQLERTLEQKQRELQLTIESKRFRCKNYQESVQNLEVVYLSAMEAYKLGNLTFSELQIIFMEWQQETINSKLCEFELAQLKLIRE